MLQPFRTFYRLGATLRQANAFGTFHQIIRVLRKIHIQISWIPIVALSHGAVSQHTNKQHCQQAEKILKQFNAGEKPVGTIQTIKTLWSIVRSQIFYFVKTTLFVHSKFPAQQGNREVKKLKTPRKLE